MNKESLIISLIDKLLGESNETGKVAFKPLIGEYVIVRCRNAGVHSGILVDYNGGNVELKESRRLWYFKCKTGHSLSGVALHGITGESKIAGELPSILLPDACEIIPVNADAERSIRDAKEYNS
ncbi:MAG: hypothetical protein PQJ60_10845 [Spirochaetales bacterium]|nr:hypothetical protein [Spirochaetales bacterium]